jgi:hypothetical protein
MTIITNTKFIPLSIHLIGNKVLGVTIDIVKANGDFFSSNEMFGTLISGIGLNNTLAADNYINKTRMHRNKNIRNGTEEKESMTIYDAILKSSLFS